MGCSSIILFVETVLLWDLKGPKGLKKMEGREGECSG